MCFGPNQGRNVTFVNPKKWIGNWQTIEPELALREVARRYLRAYGPTRPENLARWWELRLIPARKLFQSLEDELEEVDVEGWRGLALRSTIEPMQSLEAPSSVNLLPLFDAYTFGFGRDLDPILPKTHETRVFRPQGWITAVVLVNGCVAGVWEHKTRRSQAMVKVRMFASPTASVEQGIEAETERFGTFLNSNISLGYEDL